MSRSVFFLLLSCCVLLVFNSCRVEKRLHRPGYHVEWVKKKPTTQAPQNTQKEDNESFHSSEADNEPPELAVASNQSSREIMANLIKKKVAVISKQLEATSFARNGVVPGTNERSGKKDDVRQCETLVLLDGRRILIFVVEIGEEEIRYKRCDDARGKIHSVLHKDVLRIEYPDGTQQDFQSEDEEVRASGANESSDEARVRELETIGAGAFALSLFLWVALFFSNSIFFLLVFLILGVLSLTFSIMSLRRFQSDPSRFKGKGLTIAGMVISILALLILLWLVTDVLF